MNYSKNKNSHIVAGLFSVLLVIVLTLPWSNTVFGEQKSITLPAGTKVEKIGTVPEPVNITEVLKNQLKSCEKDAQELLEQNNTLQKQNNALQQQNAVLQKKLNDATVPGGSSVKAYCESPTVSRNTAGATNNCAVTGYMCEPVSGLCRTSCSKTSNECAKGYYCDTGYSWRCIK